MGELDLAIQVDHRRSISCRFCHFVISQDRRL